MRGDAYQVGTSDLEEEFELEFEGVESGGPDDELELDEELDDEFELDEELDDEFELDEELELEEELGYGGSRDESGYAERLYELSTREFESESEVDNALREVFDGMEKEYFFGSLKRLAKRGLGAGLRRLAARARRLAPGLPLGQALQGLTQLARGNLKGSLAALAKSGLSTVLRAHPGGAAALTALQALGFKESEVPEDNREAWGNFVTVAREAYEYLATNLDETSVTPQGANAQASAALQSALRAGTSALSRGRQGARPPVKGQGPRRRVIRVRRGDRLLIVVK